MDDHGHDIPEQPSRGPWGAAAPYDGEAHRVISPGRPGRRHSWLASMFVALLAMGIAFGITLVLAVIWTGFSLPGEAVVGWAFPALCALVAVRVTLWLKR